ncbi:UNVERIFIED_CONTAM: hypothetical protein HDU68_011634 [Siphonaria sp. JEL0065]|nr:hypothetical protein HDU68_011634 [Siphonaria sp. JEL0065]
MFSYHLSTQDITIDGLTVSCVEDNVDKNDDLVGYIAKRAWPAANVLSEYFIWRFNNLPLPHSPCTKKPFRMLELGAGTGLTSLFVGKALLTHIQQPTQQPIEIHVSDLDVAVPLIAQNIAHNFTSDQLARVSLKALDLNWGAYETTTPSWIRSLDSSDDGDVDGKEGVQKEDVPPIDLIYASDVVYFPHLFDLLVQTLVTCARNGLPERLSEEEGGNVKGRNETKRKQPEIILTCRIRQLEKEEAFYTKLGKYFHLCPLDDNEWDQGRFWRMYRGEYVMFRCVLRDRVLDSDGSEDFQAMLQASMDTDLFE